MNGFAIASTKAISALCVHQKVGKSITSAMLRVAIANG